jgi:hypothetical protein
VVAAVVERFSRALGAAVSTPEWVNSSAGGLERASYRVWRWRCPVCRAGDSDPDQLYRPFSVDSDGEVWCSACDCSAEEVRREVQIALDVRELLDALGVGS